MEIFFKQIGPFEVLSVCDMNILKNEFQVENNVQLILPNQNQFLPKPIFPP